MNHLPHFRSKVLFFDFSISHLKMLFWGSWMMNHRALDPSKLWYQFKTYCTCFFKNFKFNDIILNFSDCYLLPSLSSRYHWYNSPLSFWNSLIKAVFICCTILCTQTRKCWENSIVGKTFSAKSAQISGLMMHTAWGTDRRNSKSACSCTTAAWGSQNRVGRSHDWAIPESSENYRRLLAGMWWSNGHKLRHRKFHLM